MTTDIYFCDGQTRLNSNNGFGFANEDGINNKIYTGQATASACQKSSTCYVDRRDYSEPQFNPNTPPVRYGIHVLP